MRWLTVAGIVVLAITLQVAWIWWQAAGAGDAPAPSAQPTGATGPSDQVASTAGDGSSPSPLQAAHAEVLALAQDLADTATTLADGRRRFTIDRADWRGWLIFDDTVLQQASLHVPSRAAGAIADEKKLYHLLRSLAQSTGAEPAAAAVMAKGTVAALRSGRPMKDIDQHGFQRSTSADGLQISVTGASLGVIY